MTVDTNIGPGEPGVAAFKSETFGGPPEPRFGDGEASVTHEPVTAEANITFPLYSVVSIINGVIAMAVAGSEAGYASGTITFASTGPADGESLSIGGIEYLFVTALSSGPTVPYEVVRSDTVATTAANLADAINGVVGDGVSEGTTANPHVTASADAGVVTVVADEPGLAGNAIEFADVDAANTTFDPSSDVLGGGAAGGSKRAFGILAQPMVMTNGQSATVPVYRSGHWNMDALTFDDSYDNDEKKKGAFLGSFSPTIFVSKPEHNADAIY
jgi:hypothetical protein